MVFVVFYSLCLFTARVARAINESADGEEGAGFVFGVGFPPKTETEARSGRVFFFWRGEMVAFFLRLFGLNDFPFWWIA